MTKGLTAAVCKLFIIRIPTDPPINFNIDTLCAVSALYIECVKVFFIASENKLTIEKVF